MAVVFFDEEFPRRNLDFFERGFGFLGLIGVNGGAAHNSNGER